MANQRNHQSANALFGTALKACLICLAIVFCSVGYVWEKRQIEALSGQIQLRETKLNGLREQNEKARRQLAGLLSPRSLETRAAELKLGLVPPPLTNIWRMTEPAVATEPRKFAANGMAQ